MSTGSGIPIDPVALARGMRVERLDPTAGAPFPPGILLRATTVAAVLRSSTARRGLEPVRTAGTRAPEGPVPADDRAGLEALGWITADGGLSATGHQLRTDLGPAPATWTLTACGDHGPQRARVLVGRDWALALAEERARPGTHPRVTADDRRVRVTVVARSGLPLLLASWAGLGPAWPLEPATVVPVRLVDARLRDPSVPAPPGADVVLRSIWANPWVRWSLSSPAGPVAKDHLHAGERGQFRLQPTPDGRSVRFVPQPATLVWGRLIAACQQREDADDGWGAGSGR